MRKDHTITESGPFLNVNFLDEVESASNMNGVLSEMDQIFRFFEEEQMESPDQYRMECQILRSAGEWSMGLHKSSIEKSIQLAYLSMIIEADHLIYIENQFFVSSLAGNQVENKIAQALVNRIIRAHEDKANFKVVIVTPLLPGFEGQVEDSNSNIMRIQLGWQHRTLSKGQNSMFGQLKAAGINPHKYLKVYGLRNHGLLPNGKPSTEIVYVHSKMMIVDDKIALIGSANINDRSMMGSRDSELAVIVNDPKVTVSTMNGLPYEASEFAYTLRTKCWKDIFGFVDEEEVADPLTDDLWYAIDSRTKVAT
jgi:phospholipase D1/2